MSVQADTRMGYYFHGVLYQKHLKDINGVQFTSREVDVIAFILSGRSAKKTADLLSISPKTVDKHVHHIMEKLQCNAREGIIDFIEQSGKALVFKCYYLSVLIRLEFEKALKNIAKVNEHPACVIVYWTLPDEPYMADLTIQVHSVQAHLALTGVKVIVDKRDRWQSLGRLAQEPSGSYTVYLLPSVVCEDASWSDEDINSHSKYFALPVKKDLEELSGAPPDQNYYCMVFDILKALFPQQPIGQYLEEFQRRLATLSHLHNPGMESLITPGTSEKLHRTEIQPNFINKKRTALFSLVCLVLAGLWYTHSGQRDSSAIQVKLVRSELYIPSESAFLNRPALLGQMARKFREHPTGIQTIVLTGIGGSGKTTLARQYAKEQKIPVIWEINAETRATLLRSFESLAYALAKTDEEKRLVRGFNEIKAQEERERRLFEFIEGKLKVVSSWLLIYDNAETMNKIREYFPTAEARTRGKIIMTTRDSMIQDSNPSHVIPITELSADEKLDLFSKIMGVDMSQKENAKAFLTQVPPFPLDVSTAAYYLKITNTSYSNYLEHIKKPSDDFNEVQEIIAGDTSDYTKSRYQIMSMPLKSLLDANQGFDSLLLFISLLDASHIPRDLLEELNDNIRIDKLVVSLKKYSLLSSHTSVILPKLTTYSLHRSTQALWLAYLT
ncbi:MAG: LuxR C-terminal-related transcriptional regulator, partial [Alphaproteobacteria bacterium]